VTFPPAGTVQRESQFAIPHDLLIVWFVAFVDVTDHGGFTVRSNADGSILTVPGPLDSTSCSRHGAAATGGGVGRPARQWLRRRADVTCSPLYWTNPRILQVWRVGRTRPFNAVFGVSTFPRKSLLTVLTQPGGGPRALGREGVLSLLTALTPGSGYRYTPRRSEIWSRRRSSMARLG
jgi:hypothetical protein